jgi:hypothetical protein
VIVSADVMQHAEYNRGLFVGVVAIARSNASAAWISIGGDQWPEAVVREMLTAAIVSSLHVPVIRAAASHILHGLELDGVELVGLPRGPEDAWARRHLWAMACAHADDRLWKLR